MQIVMLGPVQCFSDDGTSIEIRGSRLRMLLVRLALGRGRPVSAETLIDDLWGQDAPSGAMGALQVLVSRLRKALSGAAVVEHGPGGYLLPVGAQDLDVPRFEELAAQGRREMEADRVEEGAGLLGSALALWRGPALADVLEAPFARNAATRLEDLRVAAQEDYLGAKLRLGRHGEAVADLMAAAAAHPLRERMAELLMRALAGTGRQSDALSVYADIRARLSEELGVDPSAELQEVHLALLRGELDRPAAAQLAPNRLPAQLTSFIGRETQLEQLAALLTGSRLVTVVGPGGAGKTRLALEAVTRHPAFERGRVWFAPLAGVEEPERLPDAVLGALPGLFAGGQPQPADPVDRLVERLDVGDAVLVLDNCEHLVEPAAKLAEQLLTRLPHLRIVATSREPLAITGEALCHLGPLDVPPPDADLAEAAASAAVRLFVERAAGVKAGFALEEPTLEVVGEICRRLDGMPLALELAAAKMRSMSVEQIARRLDDRFRLLTSGSRTALPRQRTLRAMVEWSWDLLDEPEQVLARRLSAFPGGASLTALEEVCSDERLPAHDVLGVLGSLVEKSMVQQVDDRYRMLETIRTYAAACLAESGDCLSTRFADHFLALAEQHEPLLRTGQQLRAIAVFDAEHDNLLFGLRTALNGGDTATAARFTRALFWYWGLRGMSSQYTASAVSMPDQVRAAFSAVQTMTAPMHSHGPATDAEAAEITWFHPAVPMLRMAQLASATDDADDADLAERRLHQALTSADPWVRASALWTQDHLRTEQGDLLSGAQVRLEVLRGFEQVGDRWGLLLSLLRISRDHSLRAEHEQSLATAERAVAISSELGTEMHLFWARTRLARERMNVGDLAGARRDIAAALHQARERGHRATEANLYASVSIAHRLAGELEPADQALDRMETLARRLPSFEGLPSDATAGFRMAIRLADGAPGPARALLPEAIAPLFVQGHANGLAWGAELVAGLLALEDDPAGAARALGLSEVIRGAFDQGDPELRTLVGVLTERLGEDAYREAYRRGQQLPRPQALAWLAAL